MLSVSLAKARVRADRSNPSLCAIPIVAITRSIIWGRPPKSVIDLTKALIDSFSFRGRALLGITLIVSILIRLRRRLISIANRVYRLSFYRKRISIRALRVELFPIDWLL